MYNFNYEDFILELMKEMKGLKMRDIYVVVCLELVVRLTAIRQRDDGFIIVAISSKR